MEENNNVNEFNLKQDWNFNKMIFKGDEWVQSNAYDNAHGSMLDYLEIESEEELTSGLLDEAQQLIDYLGAPDDKGGLGVGDDSPTYYGYQRVVADWQEEFEYPEGVSI